MDFWEFLLQKEGDISSVPVKIPTLQLEEGKYQIYAKSSRINADIEVKLTYTKASEVVSQKYQRRSNQQGFMQVLPLTYLQPGIWELRCRGDMISELFGQYWQAILIIRVLQNPQNTSTTGILSPTPHIHQELPKPSNHVNYEKNGSAQTIIQSEIVIDDLILGVPVAVKNSPKNTIKLSLAQHSYSMSLTNRVEISGTIDTQETQQFWNQSFEGRVYYQLRDPQTGQILLNLQQELQAQTLPLAFSYTIQIPDKWQTCLILGEVILEFIADNPEGSTHILNATESFTIVAEPKKISETLDYIEALSTWKKTRPRRLQPKSVDLPDTDNMEHSAENLRPSIGRILPPKINHFKKNIPPLSLPKPPEENNHHPNGNSSKVDQDFDGLKVRDRFWSRLSDLAEED